MFESKSKIKVIIIGNDGISRKYWVEHDADFYDRKYKIDQDAIYQSAEGRFTSKMVPTIMFRANNVIPISYKVKPSQPDPDEMGMSISRAAWAIAELMRRKDDMFKTMITILLIIACIAGAASTYMGYDNGQKLVKIQDKLNETISAPSVAPVNPYAQPTTPLVQPTPIPTIIQPIPVITPVPQLVV